MQEREAINEILVNINELPLDDDDIIADVNIATVANKFLNIAKTQVLSEGWYFNTLTMSLLPNTSGYIVIPKSFISVDGSSDTDTYAVRDYKLFNKDTQTFIFDASVECDIIDDIVFDDIPYSVANYIVKIASASTYANIVGDVSGMQMRATLVKEAKVSALREDANRQDGNLLSATFVTTALDRTSL